MMKRLLTILCIPALLLLGAAEVSGEDPVPGHTPRNVFGEEIWFPDSMTEAQIKEAINYILSQRTERELKPLAERGHAAPQYHLGEMYKEGKGVIQDYAKAVKWLRKAAEQGHAEAQFDLGLMYNVLQDYVQAHMWFNLLAAQGQGRAAGWRAQVAEKMTPAQVAKAQRLASRWTEKHRK